MNMDIVSVNYQNMLERGKSELKKVENRGVSRAETLEDLRDTTGKSFRTSDLEKLMEKYDPDAYAEYSKYAKGAGGAGSRGSLTYLSSWIDSVKKGLQDGTISSDGTGSTAKTGEGEAKLSSKAQDFLKNLRKKYGDYDFFIGSGASDWKTLAKSGTKEFTVIFSDSELERMANDEAYAKEKLASMEQAVKMSERINEKFGFESGFGKDGIGITKMGIVFNDDGTTSFFAEMEKSSERSRENLEKIREEKRTQRKAEEKRADKKAADKKVEKEIRDYARSNGGVKRVSLRADSMDALMEKMASVDWAAVAPEEIQNSGTKYDFRV